MVTSMIPNVNNIFVNKSIVDMRFLSANIPYNPLINYDWSTTTTSGLRYLKDVGSTPTYNASMYFGRGAYLNGVDQTITVPINTTIQTALKRVNGVVTINETSQTLTNYVISGLGVHKDYYLFTRLLTTAEKDSYTNTPELFYAMAQADSNCVLNMPMCETSSTVRNYKTGIDYPITNYTTSVRDNAKKLQYGLQTCKFVRDSLGVIQGASDYLEGDGVGYGDTGWKPGADEDFSIEINIDTTGNSWELYGNEHFRIGTDPNRNNLMFYTIFGGGHQSLSRQPDLSEVILTYKSNKTYSVYVNKVLKLKDITILTVMEDLNNGFGLLAVIRNTGNINHNKGSLSKFKVHNKLLTNEEIQAL